MSLQPIKTKDGSSSLYSDTFDEPYHSRHGAIQESQHVFIQKGLVHYYETNTPSEIQLFEMGFGTGLNALLTYQWAQQNKVKVSYTSIEKYPLDEASYKEMNYAELLGVAQNQFLELHSSPWGKAVELSAYFTLKKSQTDLEQCAESFASNSFDLVFFDAFAPSSQPQLWETEVFQALRKLMRAGAMLTTYCAKGQVRRNMIEAGFSIEKVPGPPGKREMLRATK